MTLTANEAGSVFYQKRPGAVLDAGSVIARLELDDASLVTKALDYKGQFPEVDVSTPTMGDKLNHVHNSYRQMLDNILAGIVILLLNVWFEKFIFSFENIIEYKNQRKCYLGIQKLNSNLIVINFILQIGQVLFIKNCNVNLQLLNRVKHLKYL